MNLYSNYEAMVRLSEIKQRQYLEEAARHRMIREAQGERTGLLRRAGWAAGPLLVSLGAWLMKGKDVCQEMQERQSSLAGVYPER